MSGGFLGGRSRTSVNTSELPDVEPFADAKRRKIYLDASAGIISKFLAEGAVGSLEGEAE